MTILISDREAPNLWRKLVQVPWLVVILISALAAVGLAMQYSAANGSWDPWASRQAVRFAMGAGFMLVVALIDIRFWFRWAYLCYAAALIMLVAVEAGVGGRIGMGAQRWLDFGFIQLQPSELMKFTLVLVLARHWHGRTMDDMGRIIWLMIPAVLVALPTGLVMRQPDLGMAIMLVGGAIGIAWIAGVRWWKFALAAGAIAAAVPTVWEYYLRDYQRQRVLTFLDPTRDPLGAGYHIIQSKIALGSGGIGGKGFLQGTQHALNFLPEKHTDFIFTMLAEEFGLIGGIGLLGLYLTLFAYGFLIAFRSQTQFGRLVAIGVVWTIFLAVFVNIAMVMGLIPAKGAALPMVSYGGSSMLVTMFGAGLLMSAWIHRDSRFGPRGEV
jgi:rod shape determining protein RodA